MKRKPLNKSRFTYLKHNTPLNVVPEKRLKKADLAGLIENRGKSRFRTKRLRESVETLIRSDLVFKNKTNAKPHAEQLLTCFATFAEGTARSSTTFVPQFSFGNTLKARYPFHLNMNAKRSVHFVRSKTCFATFACCATQGSTPRSTARSSTSAASVASHQQPSCVSSKAHQQKKTCFARKALRAKQHKEIGTKYIVKRTVLGSTRIFSNTRFKVHSQDLKQLVEGRGRKVSPYKARLLERKKLSLIYGNLGWRELRKCVLQSKHKKGVASPKSGNKKTRPQTSSLPENLITLLESRLDVVLYRCRFFPSFSSCKQAINHGKIFVNHRQVRIAGHLLKAGDLIQVNHQSKQSLPVGSESTDLALHEDPLSTTFKQEITRKKHASKSERNQSLPISSTCFAYCCAYCFATEGSSSRAAIGSKTFVACPDSARDSNLLLQEHVVSKKANYLLALENEKQKTLLYFQNKIKSRPFSPFLPSTLLTRFDPLHHFPWNTKQKPNHPLHNNKSKQFVADLALHQDPTNLLVHGHNKQDYGSCFLPHTLMLRKATDSLSTTFKRTKTPSAKQLNLENQANSLFRNLKERKRILRTLSSRSNEKLHGDGKSFQHVTRSTDRLIKPLRNRDNPSLFLRCQSKSGVLRAKQSTGLKKLFPPFYRAVKPLNLEISYQTLTAIFLFPPQKVYFPAHIDLEMIGKSI